MWQQAGNWWKARHELWKNGLKGTWEKSDSIMLSQFFFILKYFESDRSWKWNFLHAVRITYLAALGDDEEVVLNRNSWKMVIGHVTSVKMRKLLDDDDDGDDDTWERTEMVRRNGEDILCSGEWVVPQRNMTMLGGKPSAAGELRAAGGVWLPGTSTSLVFPLCSDAIT